MSKSTRTLLVMGALVVLAGQAGELNAETYTVYNNTPNVIAIAPTDDINNPTCISYLTPKTPVSISSDVSSFNVCVSTSSSPCLCNSDSSVPQITCQLSSNSSWQINSSSQIKGTGTLSCRDTQEPSSGERRERAREERIGIGD